MATHTFDVDLAAELGVNAAIIADHIAFFCEHSKSNGTHEHDGLYWMYDSTRSMTSRYPYMSTKAVRTALGRLMDAGYVVSSHFNDESRNNVTWYAVTDKWFARFTQVCPQGQTESAPLCPQGQTTLPSGANSLYIYNGTTNGTPYSPPEGDDAQTAAPQTATSPSPATQPLRDDDRDDPVAVCVALLNSRAGTHYKASTPMTRRLVQARMREGFTVDDFRRVIEDRCSRWLHDPKMREYLRPKTLFGTKFEGYLNSAGGSGIDLSVYDG